MNRFFPGFLTVLLLLQAGVSAQPVSYYFPLDNGFSDTSGTVTLTPVPNAAGNTGVFQPSLLSGSVCPGGLLVNGWAFEQNAGLEFQNNGFLTNEWTVAYLYRVDQYSSPYIRQFATTHVQEIGFFINPVLYRMEIYIYQGSIFGIPQYLTPVPVVSPNNTIYAVQDYYFVFTRDNTGMIRFYLNGSLQGSYNDAAGDLLPGPPDDRLMFFHDYFSGFFNPMEADPGWVSDLSIANYVWHDSVIQAGPPVCTNALLYAEVQDPAPKTMNPWPQKNIQVYPNPADEAITVSMPELEGRASLSIFDINGRPYYRLLTTQPEVSIQLPDQMSGGMYWVVVTGEDGRQWQSMLRKF